MSSEDKPEPRTAPPSPGESAKREASSPSLEELDSSWEGEEELDEDATMVQMVPRDLVALSRRGEELDAKKKPEKTFEEPEKHEAITARPPPGGEASVVVDAPHQDLPKSPERLLAGDDEDDDEEEDEEEELAADDLDAGWDVEEERAAAADVAAGLDEAARRLAAEQRAMLRKEKARAKKLAAKDKRKARADAVRQKQKKPKKRSTVPPRPAAKTSTAARLEAEASAEARQHPTIPPKASRAPDALAVARRDMIRMVLLVAIVVVIGALLIGIARR